MALRVDLGPGDTLEVGGSARIQVEHKTGRRTRVAVSADPGVTVIHTRAERPEDERGESPHPQPVASR